MKYSKNQKIYLIIEICIVILAIAVSVSAQWPSFVNKYVINDDVRQQIYWMQQFRDPDIFQNDLLNEYAKYIDPWGIVILYYILSFFLDPLVLSKIIPIFLFAVSVLYVFKLTKYISNNFAGILAAFSFIFSPYFLGRMSGGLARGFCFPLMASFLYYLIKKNYRIANVLMIAQALFYPVSFLICGLTYFLTLIKIQNKRIMMASSRKRIIAFFLTIFLCTTIIFLKHSVLDSSNIGNLVTRKQMVNNAEYYNKGRFQVLPVAPLHEDLFLCFMQGNFIPGVFTKIFSSTFSPGNIYRILYAISIFLLIYLLIDLRKKKLKLPFELVCLFFASLILFKVADIFLLKLFLPRRYLQFSIPLLAVIIFSLSVSQLLDVIRNQRIRKVVQICLLIILLNFNFNKGYGLADSSHHKELYLFLETLPKDTMIAAYPYMANGIPTFARRKVFINEELSHPFFDLYWKKIKRRTFDFFDAYFAEDLKDVYDFCLKNNIDYLVVEKRYFATKGFQKAFYFEPFDTYIRKLVKTREVFALENINEQDKLFSQNDIFVIHKDALIGKK